MEETADTYLPEHPWPYLGELFELEKRKKDSFYFECLLCLPKHNTNTNYFKFNRHCLHCVFG